VSENKKKTKTTVYITVEEETLSNDLFIKRLRQWRKTDKSALFFEGIRLLFEKEIGDEPNEGKRAGPALGVFCKNSPLPYSDLNETIS